jgi:[ribosomal protein S5]-alanine N-acetyltransferase
MRAPESFTTERLLLRRPVLADAPAIFARYASDERVTRWVGFPRHVSAADARSFVRFSDEEWATMPVGPLLAFEREGGRLVGSTGISMETTWRASTGYLLAADSFGRGYATEMARAMVELGKELRLRRLYALCHVDHRASAHVLEKSGFAFEGRLRRYMIFPNLGDEDPADVECWAWTR